MGLSGDGGRSARLLRVLLLVVMTLAAVEYLFGSILEASPLKTYIDSTTATNDSIIETVRNESSPLLLKLINSLQNLTAEKGLSNTTNRVEYKGNLTNMSIAETESFNKTLETTTSKSTTTIPSLPYCETPQDLGPIEVTKSELALERLEKRFPDVQWGGIYSPLACIPMHKVAIIVPFRDRQQHLTIFLNHMHDFLRKQNIEYGIFIIEQKGNGDFNRAKLMNVGFVESQKMRKGGWQCFIFHDVDLLPLDTSNLYTCPRQPRHMSAAIDKFNFKLPYKKIFGGVSAMSLEQFKKVDGFSNKYWGWGGEDDDMSNRLKKNHYYIERYNMSIARYTMLDHNESAPNPKRYQLLKKGVKSFRADGLSTLEYELVEVCQNQLYTHIIADISEKS